MQSGRGIHITHLQVAHSFYEQIQEDIENEKLIWHHVQVLSPNSKLRDVFNIYISALIIVKVIRGCGP